MLRIADLELSSRLIVGTGKYRDFETMQACHRASGTQMVTVAIRRVDLACAYNASLPCATTTIAGGTKCSCETFADACHEACGGDGADLRVQRPQFHHWRRPRRHPAPSGGSGHGS